MLPVFFLKAFDEMCSVVKEELMSSCIPMSPETLKKSECRILLWS
jgi:hypothetical protein